MEAYLFECASPEFDELARVIADIFPEQTRFAEEPGENGVPQLVVHWVAMRFGAKARRMALTRKGRFVANDVCEAFVITENHDA